VKMKWVGDSKMCCVEGARIELLLLIADAQKIHKEPSTLWIFSMGTVFSGALLFSAWLDPVFQPHHCRIKDWRYSAAAAVIDGLC
jgi:hypothetical protein